MNRLLVTALLAVVMITVARADIIIRNDGGGNVAVYKGRVAAVLASGERVVIDGLCGSACALYLSLPPSQICATSRGRFVFHAATTELGLPHPLTNDAVLRAYPPRVRNYILQRGGLWITPITASARMFVRAC